MPEQIRNLPEWAQLILGVIAVGGISGLCGWLASKIPENNDDDDGPCGVD